MIEISGVRRVVRLSVDGLMVRAYSRWALRSLAPGGSLGRQAQARLAVATRAGGQGKAWQREQVQMAGEARRKRNKATKRVLF